MQEDEKARVQVESTVTNPHDMVFKRTFKEIRIAKDILQHNLPKEMLQDIDLNTLQLLDGSFVSSELKETFTDVLYEVKIAKQNTYIAFLLEHKSYPDKFVAFQVSRYIIDLWEKSFKEKDELPIVIPIIFYHGKQPWNYETDIRNYIPNYKKLPDYLKNRLPTIKHDFITMKTHNQKQMQIYHPLTRLILRSFKYIFYDIDTLLEQFLISIDDLKKFVSDEDVLWVIELMIIYYEKSNREFSEEKLMRKSQALDGKGEEIMNIFQAREEKGILKGREEGKKAGIELGKQEGIKLGKQAGREETALEMLKDGLPIARIAKYTKLSEEKVKELQKQLQ